MSLFLLVASAWDLFDGTPSLWVSLNVVKTSWNGNFCEFIDLPEKRQVWQILSNFTKLLALLQEFKFYLQEPGDFLIFTDSVTIFFSSRSSQPKFPLKKKMKDVFLIRGTSTLKITEIGFGLIIKYFWGPFFADFCCCCQESISC